MTTNLPPEGGHDETAATPPPPPYGEPPAAPAGPPGPESPGAGFFASIRELGIYRPDDGRWFAGVAAGISRRWALDPLLVRGVFVALTLFFGVGVLLYGLAWLFLPEPDGRIHAQQVLTGDVTAGFVGASIVTVLGLSGGGPGPWWWGGHDGFWFPGGLVLAALIVGGVVLWSRNRPGGLHGGWHGTAHGIPHGTPTTPPPGTPGTGPVTPPSEPFGTSRTQPYGQTYAQAYGPAGPGGVGGGTATMTRPAAPVPPYTPGRRSASAPSGRITRAFLGLALLAAVAAFALAGTGDHSGGEQALVAAGAALATLAVGVVTAGLNGRRAGFLSFAAVLMAIGVLIGTGVHHEGIRSDQTVIFAGDRVWTPTRATEARDGLTMGFGELTVNLDDPALVDALSLEALAVPIRMGAGHMVVVLPPDVPAEVTVDQGGGEVVDFAGETHESQGAGRVHLKYTSGPDGEPRLRVQIRQGGGQIELQKSTTAATPTATPTVTPSASESAK